jgi:membrane-associated phospholipid phosphatase
LGCIAYLVGTSKARGGYRGFGVIGCAGIVATVAYSRMYLDAHWLSDVLGGVSVGLAYLLVAIWLVGSTPALAEPAVVVASVVESLPGIAAIGEVATDPAVSAMAGLGPA